METKVEPALSASLEPAAAMQTALVVAQAAKPEEQKVPTVEASTETAKEEKEPIEEKESSDEETGVVEEETTPIQKPPLVRADIVMAGKPALMDLAKAYNLEPSGTKEQLRERLLSYLDEIETASGFQSPAEEISTEKPEETPTDTEAVPPEQALEAKPKETSQEKREDFSKETPERIQEEVRREAPQRTAAAQVQVKEAGEAKPASRSMFSAAPRMVPATVPKRVAESMPQTPTSLETPSGETTQSVETTPPVEITSSAPFVVEPLAQPVVITVPTPQATAVRPAVVSHGRVRHPCPTCGRELTFVPQYDRWFCYSCRAYAPKAKAKFACPNCGASLRWIAQYSRWWCDACRRYAAGDLPKPERAAATATPALAVSHTASTSTATSTAVVHRHRSPGSGIGLLGFGMVLFVIYEILVDLPAALSIRGGALIGPDVGFALRFFAFVFVAVGAILGLSAVQDQHR
jgi:predicted RNA-binding Zn-ribbon protein involved in translation (DUF1610 family)